MIMTAKNFVEAKYEAEVIYGDSVMPDTPITFMSNSRIYVKEIGKLYDDYAWTSYPQFKPQDENITAKEQYQPTDMRVWTHKGWAKVHRVIRHRTVKKIYRVKTKTGKCNVILRNLSNLGDSLTLSINSNRTCVIRSWE
jgi:hypothetical protein